MHQRLKHPARPFHKTGVEKFLVDQSLCHLLLDLLVGTEELAALLVQHVLLQLLLQEMVGAQVLIHVAQVPTHSQRTNK